MLSCVATLTRLDVAVLKVTILTLMTFCFLFLCYPVRHITSVVVAIVDIKDEKKQDIISVSVVSFNTAKCDNSNISH